MLKFSFARDKVVGSRPLVSNTGVLILVGALVVMTTVAVGHKVATSNNQAKLQLTAAASYSTLGYIDSTMPCEHAPYNVTGSCRNYDWGPVHTTVLNSPTELSSRGYAYRNCTDYVAWKEASLGASVPSNLGNAGQWYNRIPANDRSSTPQASDAAVQPGTSSNPYGHVAFIESVNSNGTITVSEYNYDMIGNGDTRTATAASMGFTEFINFGAHSTSSNVAPSVASSKPAAATPVSAKPSVPNDKPSASSPPVATEGTSQVVAPVPTPLPPAQVQATPSPTFNETVGSNANTWTDYSNAGGTEGAQISSNSTVQIACKVTGFKVADGDTWWYRIASGPWNSNYYVSADAFYNNGQTSGSLHGTPFVDNAVPNC
jgi:surface antigen